MIQGKLLFLAIVFAVFVSSQVTWADPPDHANLPDQAAASQNNEGTPVMNQVAQGATQHERKLKPGARSGLIKTNNHVYYCDDDVLSLSVVLPHSLEAYWEGEADAYLVIQIPGDASSDDVAMVPLKLDPPPAHPNPTPQKAEEHQQHIIQDFDLTDFPCEKLEGDYQIALILTKPISKPEDALNILNWYDGFQGLVAISKISFAVSASDEDVDSNGEADNDIDGDGYSDN
ncbi:MAG: hypothetical protein JRJ43_07750 [Deltaproteobacteria bacterium]|nr:hypothetical protein [Deltaproteobacteria bacterium]MBW1719445.1 hypothetical protein [Deltaproteobacteria bacterium]MBW1938887.1 hypothetical protein [Deltaproteobacteria bacterium]MBW1964796.1 hypothetical protein [Deltaproteobacteria bacterium]MBW2079572.1 hypothetical protein [Deltaproteobacteria bacterium]